MENEKRHYRTTELPTLTAPVDTDKRTDILTTLYAETNANYRNLADVRFRLLGLVPAVSVIAWAELLDKVPAHSRSLSAMGFLITMLALRITYGVYIYHLRNDELYNDLVSRGRKIEEELGVHTAIFLGRPEPQHKDKVLHKLIQHGLGLGLIYSSVFIGWILLLLWYAYRLGFNG